VGPQISARGLSISNSSPNICCYAGRIDRRDPPQQYRRGLDSGLLALLTAMMPRVAPAWQLWTNLQQTLRLTTKATSQQAFNARVRQILAGRRIAAISPN